MAKDPDEIVVGQNGEIYTAPTGATLPTSQSGTPNAAFDELGYASEDGVTLSDGKTVEDVRVWQSFYPARRIITAREFNVSFALRQWNEGTVKLAFGGTITEPTAGNYKFSPPEPEELDIRAVIVDWRDGDRNYRLVVPKAIVTETVETNVNRGSASDLPITLSVLAEEGDDDPWNIYTDDPSWES